MSAVAVIFLLATGVMWAQGLNTSIMMDPSVDPCDNFYQYACGKFIKEAKFTDLDLEKGFSDDIAKQLDADIIKLVSAPLSPDDTRVSSMLKKVYQGCMNVDLAEQLGIEPMHDLLSTYWSNSSYDETTYSWMDTTARLYREQGISPFVAFFSLFHDGRDVLTIDIPSLMIGEYEYYLDDEYVYKVDAFRTYINDLWKAVGNEGESSADYLIALDRQLAKLIKESNDAFGDEAKKEIDSKVSKMKTDYQVPFADWFSSMAKNGLDFADNDDVKISNRADYYLKNLPKVLSNYSVDIISSYQLVYLALLSVPNLSPSRRQFWVKYTIAFYNDTSMAPDAREYECSRMISSGDLIWPMSSMYIRYAFNTSKVDKVNEIYYHLKDVMAQMINEASWMDQQTATMARKKLNSIAPLLLYPDYSLDESIILRDFDGVQVYENKFFASASSLRRVAFNAMKRELKGKPAARYGWPIAPVDLTGTTVYNTGVFAGIRHTAVRAQSPLLLLDEEDSVNYGRIGVELARLFLWHFHSIGCTYDWMGREVEWCSKSAVDYLKNGDSCLKQQYSKIVDPVLGTTLPATFGEGILVASSGAIRMVFAAFKEWEARNRLPSSNTRDRNFFIAHAQGFCSAPKLAFRQRVLNPVSPISYLSYDYAVNLPLQNFPKFSDVFMCPPGSKMNPTERCSAWGSKDVDSQSDKIIHI